MIRTIKIPTITGNTSAATPRPIAGKVIAVYVEYAITPNAATDVTIATVNSPVKTILTLTNNTTDGWFYPREVVNDTAGADVTYDGTNEIYESIPVDDYIKATVAQGDADQTLDVWVLYED